MSVLHDNDAIIKVLNNDTIIYLVNFLKDNDKMNFMKTCSSLYEFRDKIQCQYFYHIRDISNLKFINKFQRIIYKNKFKIPDDFIDYGSIKSIKSFTVTSDEEIIPNNTIHLVIGRRKNIPNKINIPPSVTHITFGYYYNKSIKGFITNNITHITFGESFDQPIQQCIPHGSLKIYVKVCFYIYFTSFFGYFLFFVDNINYQQP